MYVCMCLYMSKCFAYLHLYIHICYIYYVLYNVISIYMLRVYIYIYTSILHPYISAACTHIQNIIELIIDIKMININDIYIEKVLELFILKLSSFKQHFLLYHIYI
jgi:hypothetical protein